MSANLDIFEIEIIKIASNIFVVRKKFLKHILEVFSIETMAFVD